MGNKNSVIIPMTQIIPINSNDSFNFTGNSIITLENLRRHSNLLPFVLAQISH